MNNTLFFRRSSALTIVAVALSDKAGVAPPRVSVGLRRDAVWLLNVSIAASKRTGGCG